MAEDIIFTSVQCLAERILVHYQFHIQKFRKTPQMVAKKIKAMKDNKSPGVDEIPPKQLMETVEQISIPYYLLLDFERAFDKVPHQRVVLKLKANGIGDGIIDWIEQWLTDGRQRVVVNGTVSN